MPVWVALLFTFLILSLMSGLGIENEVCAYLERDSKNRRWDGRMPDDPEKWYMPSPHWVKKYVWPADPVMPKFLYYEIIHGIICVLLGPVNIILCLIWGYKLFKLLILSQGFYGVLIRIISGHLFYKMWKERV